MKLKIKFLTLIVLMCLQTGCGKSKDVVYLEAATEATERSGAPSKEVQIATQTAQAAEQVYYVHVCGAVKIPGVYMLTEGARVYEAIALAGGFAEDALADYINQAAYISDGQMLYIPREGERAEPERMERVPYGITGEASDGKVNLNTASVEELMTLPGIGETKAKGIVSYRTEHGDFSSPEEIMNVEGIKEGLYNRVKDNIKVK
ncbi:MAG: helix-hairpin-helix domain-containing protein [Roseburia sp.]